MNVKALSAQITSYDLFKTFAVLTMIVDHVGAYFMPEDLWWRAVGRLSFPVWFFLIGYARSRDLSPRLWIGAALLLVSSLFVTQAYFPVTALATIILIRLVLDKTAHYMFSETPRLVGGWIIIFLAALPTSFLMDYGTQGLLLALFGYAVRHQRDDARITKTRAEMLGVGALAAYVALAMMWYDFSQIQTGFIFVACAVLFYMLSKFIPKTYSFSGPLKPMLQFCGRYTLEIYVVHLLAFKAIAWVAGVPGMGLFEYPWFFN
jgi:hypothetical protein